MKKVLGTAIMFIGVFLLIPYIPVYMMSDVFGGRLFWHRFGFNLVLPTVLPTFLEFLIGTIIAIIGWWIIYGRKRTTRKE